jgi:hypothetical protein
MPKSNPEEAKFQSEIRNTGWYKEYVKEFGEEPDLDTKDYDYRKAWKAGIRPERDPYDKNRYHWGSSDPQTGEMLKSEDHPTAWKEYYTRETGKNPDETGVTKEEYERTKKTKMAKGGTVKSQTKRLLAKGGLKQEGNTTDPVSGNNVPVGAMQEEVRDDIPAQLSEGEFVFPADVVRFIGLERLMVMRQMAKKGLMQMEDMGQMSNGDEADEDDDIAAFESEIDDIMGGMDSEDDDKPREMAVGGVVTPMMGAPAAAEETPPKTMAVPFAGEYVTVPTSQGGVTYRPEEMDTMLSTGKIKPLGTYQTMEEANAATAGSPTAKMAVGGMAMPQASAPAPAPASVPAPPSMQSPAAAQTPAALGQAPQASSGEPSTRDIISESMNTDSFTPQEKTAVSSFLMSDVAKDMVTLRNNNTLFMVMGAEPGVVTAQTFSIDPPDILQDSVSKFIASLKEANIKELRGETKNPMLLQSYEESGLVPESTEENGIISYRVTLPQDATAPAPETAPPPEMPPAAAPAPSPTPMV